MGNRLAELEHQIKQRIEEGSRKIILDLSGLTYIDSAGLGMVASCAGIVFKSGGKLVVITPGVRITEIFEMTRLNKIIDLYPNIAEARAALSAGTR